jgi:8-hydroxy-5-deazaflavin:NADPH oxidoreductase
MNITMIGAGKMGRAIGYRLLEGGHSVTLIATNTENAEKLAVELRGVAKKGALVKVAELDSVSLEDVVILALWYPRNQQVVKQLGARLAGKTVVDIANPLNSTYDALAVPSDSSSPEELAKVAPAGTKFIKAFNTAFASTLVAGNVAGQKLDIFIAGDDEAAKRTIAQLVSDGGMTPIDVGALHRARLLEGLGLLGITLQGPLHLNGASGWRLVH